MLRYKVKLNEPKGYNEIVCDELYLSPDLSFISGVTDSNYCIMDGQHLKMEFNNDNRFHDVIVKTEDVLRQGYVIFEQEFDVKEYKEYKGFYYVDGKYYFTEKSGTSITVLGQSCSIIDNKVKVNVTYWVENGKITIGENTYDVDIQLKNDDGTELLPHHLTLKGGMQLPINKCAKEFWKKVTKFNIRKDNDYELVLNDASCAKRVPFFRYNVGNTTTCNNTSKIYEKNDKKHYLEYNKDEGRYETTVEVGNKLFVQNYSKVKCDTTGEIYDLEYEWRNTLNSEFIHLFLNMPQYNFTSAQHILVESPTPIHTKCDILFTGATKSNDGYIIYCGKRYNESTDTIDYLDVEGVEHKLNYIGDKSKAYITINNNVYTIRINGENGEKLTQHSNSVLESYPIKKYHYVDIDGDKFLVKKYKKIVYNESGEPKEKADIDYVDVFRKETFTLTITEVVNNSMLRCRADIEEDGESSGICGFIVTNFKKLNFKLLNPIFSEKNILRDSFILAKNRGEEEVFDNIKIFNPSYYIKIPLSVGNDMGININQEDVVENLFFKKEIEKSINPYVDMEREVYYPSCKVDNTYKLINELKFDLHFRSRNLEDWKINEDVFTSQGIDTKEHKIKYQWNIFDNYKDYYSNNNYSDLTPSISSDYLNKADFKYYQPADLLHFLNFTTDDVFYQKSKISKSFLRLSFFNSMDVANQTLLYTCTVFMNENKLYKTYIDNIVKTDNLYVSISEELNDEEPLTSSTISVFNDTCNDGFDVTFEEEKRLAATFSVKNRYETEESAEGFYLYIFKEYCEKLHEKTIYMKVEFNHAGEGRTINFVMPFKYDTNGNPELMELNPSGADLEDFQMGYPMKELYEHLFIPINIVYDEINKRYTYYLPEGLRKNEGEDGKEMERVMKFNLYELKIKDES